MAGSPPAKISDHIPVLLAAFRLKSDDLTAILAVGNVPDELVLNNLSIVYRYSLLATVLSVRPIDLATVMATFPSPWSSAQATLGLVNLWNTMTAAGFSFQQLAYVTKNLDSKTNPLGPSQTTILRTTKTLYDGLNQIDANNLDVADINAANDTLVATNAQILLGATQAAQVVMFLDGTRTFTTNTPSGLSINVPAALATRIKYTDGSNATLQISGQLTTQDTATVKGLSSNPK